MKYLADLLALPKWTPVNSLECRSLGSCLYKTRNNLYLIAVPGSCGISKEPSSHLITSILWAQSDGAAQRIVNLAIESDETLIAMPPKEMTSGFDSLNYNDIVFALRQNGVRFMETEECRIMTDGKFVHRIISTPKLRFYFRTKRSIKEIPYGVLCILSDLGKSANDAKA